MKKVIKIIAIVLAVLWNVFLMGGLIGLMTDRPAVEEEAFGAYMTQGIYIVIIVLAFGGVVCSSMLAIAMHKFRDAQYDTLSTVEKVFLILACECNGVLYLSWFLLFFAQNVLTISMLLVWFLSSIASVILLIVVTCTKRTTGSEHSKQMQFVIKMIRNIAVVLTVLWGVVLVITVIGLNTYQPDPSEVALLATAKQMLYRYFIHLAIGGMLCSGMLVLGMHNVRSTENKTANGMKKAAAITALVCNGLLYLTVGAIFLLQGIFADAVRYLWGLSMVICLIMLTTIYCTPKDKFLRKLIVALLLLLLILSLFAGCRAQNGANNEGTEPSGNVTEPSDEATEPSDEHPSQCFRLPQKTSEPISKRV